MEIILRRHTTTANNLLRQYTGSTDVPLSEEGVALAERQPKRIDVKKVYVSTLRRTADTARILYPKAQLFPVAGLNEMDFGAFEGRSWEDMEDDTDYAAWVNSGGIARCPGGENRAEFIKRCGAALLEILKDACGETEVHIVAHGGTIMALMSRYGRPVLGYYDWLPPNCAGYRLRLAWEGEDCVLHMEEEIIAK